MAVGVDFEYRVTADSFLAVRCDRCGLLYLKHRPIEAELSRVYPATYHAFDFSPARFGLAYRVRRRLEARRILAYCRGLPSDARILDVGCGDGFHLKLLREFGEKSWILEGVDTSSRAVMAARGAGFHVHQTAVESLPQTEPGYHLILLIATIEHVRAPLAVLKAITARLRPGGRVVIVTDNAASWSFRLFRRRYWGGYHFPRHWYLFSPATLGVLATKAGLEIERLETTVSPVNWVYSIHNALVDRDAPKMVVQRFTLASPVSLGLFTLLGALQQAVGQGELLCATLRRPGSLDPNCPR